MAGTGNLVFALSYYVVDVKKVWNGAPVKFVGMNSILIYCAHELLEGQFPFGYLAENTHASQLAQNMFAVACWTIVAFRMYQLKFFVNI